MAAAAPAAAGDIRPGWFGRVGLAKVAFAEGASISAGGNSFPGAGATLSDDVTPGFGVGCRLTDRFSIIAIGGLPPTTTIEGTGPLEGKTVGKVTCGLLIVAANYHIPTRGRFQPLAGAGFNHTIGFDT